MEEETFTMADYTLPEEEVQEDPNKLRKGLTYTFIFILALSFIFDSSLFYIPQMGVELAGPSSIIAWILLAAIAMYIAFCFSELIALFPTSGGIYDICKITYGSFISFMAGWLAWIIGNIALTISIPAGLELMYPNDSTIAYVIKFFISMATILLFSYLAHRGKDIENRALAYFTIITLLSFMVLIVPMFISVPAIINEGKLTTPLNINHYSPFFVHEGFWKNTTHIFSALFIILTVIFGLEAVSFLAGEVKNPREVIPKVIPRAMAVVLGVSLIFVVGSLAVLDQATYIESWIFYEDMLKITLAGMENITQYLIPIVVFFSGMVYFSEGLGWIIASPRLIYAIARDKLFPTSFAKLDPQYQTPKRAIVFQFIILTLFLFVNYLIYIFTEEDPFYLFHSLFILLSLISASFLLISVPLLRKKYPDVERPYKVPLGNSLPYGIVGIFLFIIPIWVIYDNSLREFLISLIFIAAGIPIYFLLLFYFDPEVYKRTKKFFSFFGVFIEFFTLSRGVRNEIFEKLGSLTNKKVLEFGCGAGTLTLELAKRTLPQGEVYALDLVESSVKRVQRKMEKQQFKHVRVIHDEHQINRIHYAVPPVDAIVATHMLAHIQDLKKVLKEMHTRLPEGGRICFKDVTDLFKIFPNIGWIADPEKVVEIMHEVGFSAGIKRKKGIFWNDLYIYAIKSKDIVPLV